MNGEKIKKPPIVHGIQPDFVPGETTEYVGVQRLLPSQILNYYTGCIQLRPLLPDGIPDKRREELADSFMELFTTSLRNMREEFTDYDLWLAITGGRDSRTTLSLLEKADIQYRMFTLQHKSISEGDVVIPRKISERVKKEHYYIQELTYSNKRAQDYKMHTAAMAVDHGKEFYARSQYEELRKYSDGRILLLRSGVWEIAAEYTFKGKLTGKLDMPTLISKYKLLIINDHYRNAMLSWIDMIHSDELNTYISDDDRLYWDIREGCWLSSGEQAFDMMNGIESIHPANSRAFIRLMLAFPKNERVLKRHEEFITNIACPQIADIEYDNSYRANNGKLTPYIEKIRRFTQIAGQYGFRGTIRYYSNS